MLVIKREGVGLTTKVLIKTLCIKAKKNKVETTINIIIMRSLIKEKGIDKD